MHDPQRAFFAFPALLALFIMGSSSRAQEKVGINYPKTVKVDLVEELHGMSVDDPYRWLEDLDKPDVAAWIEAQNKVTFSYLESIKGRDSIRHRLTELWNYEKYSSPRRHGKQYFFTKNDGLQNQSVVYVGDSLDVAPRVLIDPNTLSADGTVALTALDYDHEGTKLAYSFSSGGSDWREIKVRDVMSGKDLDDHLKWVKFSDAAWAKDGSGFYYARYKEPVGNELSEANYHHKLYFHRLGTNQSDDKLVYERPDREKWGFGATVTDDGRYLIINVWEGTEPNNRVYYQNLQNEGETVTLLDDFDAKYDFIDNDGPLFYFFTSLNAPRGRVIAIDTRDPKREMWKEIIPERTETLDSVSIVGDRIVASYLQDARTLVRLHTLDGSVVGDVRLPGIGTATGFAGRRGDPETFFSFMSFNRPPTIYRFDTKTNVSTLFRAPKVGFDPEQFVVRQIFYKSKDGTRIPMFLCHRADLEMDGERPTFLYGYGGFNISLTPSFSASNIVWMEMGGVYAQANIRGGGEYGKAWHDAGKLHNKQNCFNDFISAAEYLVTEHYTKPTNLAIGGGSNGGLLVGACITQRPDLFGAALPAVGVLDMLRFHKFTIGWAWTSDYGSPDDPEMFKVLKAYSPYHNVHSGTVYPATMITTGDHDDRVVPAHSFKFAAALQAAHSGERPVLIRIETRAGHGAGKPTSKIIEEQADKWAFLVENLGMTVTD